MKLNTEENRIELNDLKAKLETKFPDYQTSIRNKKIINIAKTKTVGCVVVVNKKNVSVNGNFPSTMAQIIFTLLMILLGILLPLVLYFILFHKKMKAVEKEVSEVYQKRI